MDVLIVTPTRPSFRSGNDTTSRRWAKILRSLGHSVRVASSYSGASADLMIALHAWRSAHSIAAFRAVYPDRPLIVALSGTDIYSYIRRDPEPVLRSLDLADRLLTLQDLAQKRVPQQHRWKVRIVYQSAPVLGGRRSERAHHLDIAVIGHLRHVKDPFRAAKAARRLPRNSTIRIVHVGAAETTRWAALARAEMRRNPRYLWRGDRPHAEVRALLKRARAVVLSSLSEGGANVVSEAAAAGVPVLASRIDGTVGLLGRDYPGYFPVGQTAALTRLLWRLETDPEFFCRLCRAIGRRAYRFRPAREKESWRRLLGEVLARQPR